MEATLETQKLGARIMDTLTGPEVGKEKEGVAHMPQQTPHLWDCYGRAREEREAGVT